MMHVQAPRTQADAGIYLALLLALAIAAVEQSWFALL